MELCPKCGKNLALVGRVHRCIPSKEMLSAGYKKTAKALNEALIGSVVKSKEKLAADFLNGCPVCEVRRLKQIEAQKRWRAKKISKK